MKHTQGAMLLAVVVSLSTASAEQILYLYEDFETQTVGNQPSWATNVRPLGGNTAEAFIMVTSGTTNSAGSGNGVQLFDNASDNYPALEYNVVASNAPVSLARVDFNFAWKGASAEVTGNYANLGFGNYDENLSLNAKANRWNELRMYDNGMISFSGGTGDIAVGPADTSHSISLFINDLPDAQLYIGPDGTTNRVNADSIGCWMDNLLVAHPSLDTGDTNSITGELIGSSTNNVAKFGFSSGTSATNLNYVFDDLVFSSLDVWPIPPIPPCPWPLLFTDFETDVVGSPPGWPTTPALIRPFINTETAFCKVVDAVHNLAGEGQGVQLYDNGPMSPYYAGLEYNFVSQPPSQVSAVRVSFDFAWVTTNAAESKPLHFALGEYDEIRSFFTSQNRYTDVRFYGDGTIDFVCNAPPDTPTNDYRYIHMQQYPDSQDNLLAAGAHSLIMFVNDYDSQYVIYTGPDGEDHSLPTNSVAYWLDGALILMMNDVVTNEHIVMDLYDRETVSFPPEYIMNCDDNLGKIGFNSETTATNVNWVFDNILVTTNFYFPVEWWLDATVAGSGSLNVADGLYPAGTNLELTATPNAGWLFMGWSGDLSGDYTTQSTNLMMNADKYITATFSDDADGDGILNADETVLGTDPRNSDSDFDGLSDFEEVYTYETNPLITDTDGDGLWDGEEVHTYGTNPNSGDTDMDGFDDLFELSTGFDPTLATSTPELYSTLQPAIEFQFYATTGTSYRIEATDALSNSWESIENQITNEYPIVKRLYSIESQTNRFFRAKKN